MTITLYRTGEAVKIVNLLTAVKTAKLL